MNRNALHTVQKLQGMGLTSFPSRAAVRTAPVSSVSIIVIDLLVALLVSLAIISVLVILLTS